MSAFTGEVVLVTGAGRGIGRALALAFAREEAIVAANDLTPVNLDVTLAQVCKTGGKIKDYIFDIAKKMPVQELITEIISDWGRIDILVNNAAVHPHVSLLDMDEWDWHRTIDVNLSGAFYTTQVAGRAMRQQGGGVIINIASAQEGMHGMGENPALAASKMGLIGLTRAAATELSADNIRVNAVCPRGIETEHTKILPGWQGTGQDVSPRPNPVLPQDVVNLVLFLCSPAASHLNGQIIEVGTGFLPD